MKQKPHRTAILRLIGGLPLCLFTLLLHAANGESAGVTEADARTDFFNRLQNLCGAAYSGYSEYPADADDAFHGKLLVAKIETCNPEEIRMPFRVGTDRSRTWLLTRENEQLIFKHDHRHADGTPDELTNYGGSATPDGTALRQSFPADSETREMLPEASTNVWHLSFSEDGRRLTYYLERHGKARFKATLMRAD